MPGGWWLALKGRRHCYQSIAQCSKRSSGLCTCYIRLTRTYVGEGLLVVVRMTTDVGVHGDVVLEAGIQWEAGVGDEAGGARKTTGMVVQHVGKKGDKGGR